MRLLVVSHSCATPINQQLYAELQELTGWEITLVIPADWKDEFGNRLDEDPWPGSRVRLHKIAVRNNGNIIFHFYRINWSHFLKEGRFDAIYVNHEPYGLATADLCWANYRGNNVPFGFYSCQNIYKVYPPPFSWLEKMVYRHSSFAFPITPAVENILREKSYQGSSTVCALPLDPALYHPLEAKANEELISRQPDEVVIGYVGRLIEPKGLRTLALALALLRDLPWKLVIVGKGDYEATFRQLLEQNQIADRASFLGYVPHTETPRYLSAFDLLVVPSETQSNWKEQFGRVITEAMACGTPVIGSDSGEIPNLIRQSGGGDVFAEKKPEALAASLRKMILDPIYRRKCAQLGMSWAKENVSLRGVAERMAQAIAAARPLSKK